MLSEKAFAYKMRLEAMKRQAGRPIKDNYSPMGNNLEFATSSDELAEKVGESKNQIFRFIRLTELIPEILQLEAMKRQGQRSDLTSTPVARKSRRSETADIVGSALGESGDQVRRYIRLNELVPEILQLEAMKQMATKLEQAVQNPDKKITYREKKGTKMARYEENEDSEYTLNRLTNTKVLPSERAYVYRKIYYESRSSSRTQIQRYMKLTKLIPELMRMVDTRNMTVSAGVYIGDIHSVQQKELYTLMMRHNTVPTVVQARRMYELRQNGKLDGELMERILLGKPTRRPNDPQIEALEPAFKSHQIQELIPKEYTTEEQVEYVIKALTSYNPNVSSSYKSYMKADDDDDEGWDMEL